MSLKNKVAIVTGGNSSIGKAIALELADQGANIVIDYIPRQRRSSNNRSLRWETRQSVYKLTSARSQICSA
jgi:NAD(P)-dependent dehydrogenase (short-subunit alcohol dehydrogenase family)